MDRLRRKRSQSIRNVEKATELGQMLSKKTNPMRLTPDTQVDIAELLPTHSAIANFRCHNKVGTSRKHAMKRFEVRSRWCARSRRISNCVAQHPQAGTIPPRPGQSCLGRRAPVDGLLSPKSCPYNLEINDGTGDLDEHSYERRGDNLRYRPRCSACHYAMETSRLLRYSGLAEKPGQNCCASNSCPKANVEGLMFCEMHLMNMPDWFIVHEDHEGMKDQLKNIIKQPWKSYESLKQIGSSRRKPGTGKLREAS